MRRWLRTSHAEAVSTLARLGANLESEDTDSHTALWRAAWYGHVEVAQALLAAAQLREPHQRPRGN